MAENQNGVIRGIDVSHFQGGIDWQAVAGDGVRFCFIKATEGVGDVDPMFHRNWTGAKAAGVLRGAYHFFHPNLDARQQAEHFLSVVTIEEGTLPPALDVEVTDGVDVQDLQSGIRAWVETADLILRMQVRSTESIIIATTGLLLLQVEKALNEILGAVADVVDKAVGFPLIALA